MNIPTAQNAPMQVPGAKSYTLYFDLDHKSVSGGSYQYGPTASGDGVEQIERPKRSLNGGYIGLEAFYPLDIELTLDSGKQVIRTIDVPRMIEKFTAEQDIPDLTGTPEGGSASLMVDINGQRIKFDYVLFEDQRGPNGEFYFSRQAFPVAELAI